MLQLRRVKRGSRHAWAFTFGDALVSIEDCEPYFKTRERAVSQGERFGIGTDDTGRCYVAPMAAAHNAPTVKP